MDLQIRVRKQVLTCRQTAVSNSVNFVRAAFVFDDEWIGTSKRVIFTNGDELRKEIILDETSVCMVPWEVLSQDGTLYISVVGTVGNKRITTRYMENPIIVYASGDLSGDTPIPPTPDVYQQLVDKLSKEVVSTLNDQKGDITIIGEDAVEVATDGTKIKLKVIVDTTMSDTSENSAQNKVVKNYVDVVATEMLNYADEQDNATKDELNPKIAQKLDTIDGGTVSGNVEFTGDVIVQNAPTVPKSAVNKEYADSLKTTIDPAMSDTSENPVQNKVVKKYVDDKITPTSTMGKLIYRKELSEAVSGVTITTDDEGNNLKLKNIYLVVNVPESPTLNALSYLSCQMFVKTTVPLLPANNGTVVSGGTEGKYWQIIFDMSLYNGGWKFIEGTRKDRALDNRYYYTPANNMGFLQSPYAHTYPELLVNKIVLAPTGAAGGRILPIGTIIEIYGENDLSAPAVVDVEV